MLPRPRWDCRPLLADPEDLTVVFQPIVDLASAAVAGYEALARFPGTAAPDVWFAAAADAGLGAELEALAISRALAALPDLPPNTFLTVNVSPHLLGSAPVTEAFAGPATLRRVVVELTEHTPVDDLGALRAQTAALRARGALIAIDDAGSGYSGLQQLAELRPQLVKLDRSLVTGVDDDPVRYALAEMVGAFAAPPTLRRVVVELTGHTPVEDLTALGGQTAALRARGALIAVDAAGSGCSGLQQLAELRPQLVTLDRSLVAGVDTDPVRLALAEMVGAFAGRIDASLLAEGVETTGELAALARLGVPLVQGWLLARPAPGFAQLTPQVVDMVRGQVARARLAESVAGLLRPVRQHSADVADRTAPAPYVLLDRTGTPTGLVLADPRTGQPYSAAVSLQVPPSAGVAETLQRALTRPPAQRFNPVLCTARNGEVLGLLRVEDLASAVVTRG